MQPTTHYAKSSDIHIAYQVFGEGPDLVMAPGFVSHIENYWDEPRFARWLNRLGSFCRVVLFDKRGTGLSDRVLVERNTRFTMLVKIPRKDTTTVVAALAEHIGKLPDELRRSLTWDQGKEMHAHKRFTVATNVQVYFCDPRSPWQRGSNENTNGLLRQYFPRGTDFSRISQSYLNAIALRLNQRPRKTLGFQTPADRLQAVLH